MEQQIAGTDPRIPAGFDEVIARGMAKRPNERYQTATELAAAARHALSGPAAPPPVPPTVVDHGRLWEAPGPRAPMRPGPVSPLIAGPQQRVANPHSDEATPPAQCWSSPGRWRGRLPVEMFKERELNPRYQPLRRGAVPTNSPLVSRLR